MSEEHHVAWADRIGLNKRWEEAIKACLYSFGTNEFPKHVRAFETILVNIKDGPQLYAEVQKYKSDGLLKDILEYKQEDRRYNTAFAGRDFYERDLNTRADSIKSEKQFHYMIQLLEDNRFGFYKSTVMEDEVSLTPHKFEEEEFS